MTNSGKNDSGIVAGLVVRTEDDAAHAGSGEFTDIASDQLLALLARIGEPADVHSVPELTVQIEFGFESLQDMIADASTGPMNELAALVELGGVSGVDAPRSMPAPAISSADVCSGFGGVDQLTIKIIFGDDENNAATSGS